MNRRQILATSGVSFIAIAGCLGSYEVARQTGLITDGDDGESEADDGLDGVGPEPSDDDDGPLADDADADDDGPLGNGDETEQSNESTKDESAQSDSEETPDNRPESPVDHTTWVSVDHEIHETEYGDSEVIVYGEVRNETGYDLAYFRVIARGFMDGDFITENTIEIAGLSAGDTLEVEIPLYVEPEAIDEYRHGVLEAEYVDE